jgi:chromosome partitioning protein
MDMDGPVGQKRNSEEAAAKSKAEPMLARMIRRLLISSPKGGVGKTSFSRNIAVAAIIDGFRVATLDLDRQMTLSKWWERRSEEMPKIAHFQASLTDAQEIIDGITDFDLLVIDTPTAVEEHPENIKLLIMAADLVLIPSQQQVEDTESVTSWMRLVNGYGRPATFVLNRVNRRAKSFERAKLDLNKAGRLCPIEVGQAEDIPRSTLAGLGVLEIKGAAGSGEMGGVWQFMRNELGI